MADFLYNPSRTKVEPGVTKNWGDDANAIFDDIMNKALNKESTTTQEILADVNFHTFPTTPSANPTQDYQVTNKLYVDNLEKSISKITGNKTGFNTALTDGDFVFVGDDITGNSATTTSLQTPVTIAGISFDGTNNISISHNDLTDIGSNTHSEIDAFINSKGASNGLATLNSSGELTLTQLPAVAISEYMGNFTDLTTALADVDVQASQRGDWFTIDTDGGRSYIIISDSPTTTSDVKRVEAPTDSVLSVNGETGTVTLTTGDITEDIDKNYVTDSDIVNLSNLSGVNTGDQTNSDFDHNQLINYEVSQHRVIDDSSTTTTSLWSSDKISNELTLATTSATNVGTGAGEVFAEKIGTNLELRKIKAGSNINISLSGDDIIVAASGSLSLTDDTFEILNAADSSKVLNFDISNISPSTTRTIIMQDKDLVVADNKDVLDNNILTWMGV